MKLNKTLIFVDAFIVATMAITVLWSGVKHHAQHPDASLMPRQPVISLDSVDKTMCVYPRGFEHE